MRKKYACFTVTRSGGFPLRPIVFEYAGAHADTLVADIRPRTILRARDEFADGTLALVTERTPHFCVEMFTPQQTSLYSRASSHPITGRRNASWRKTIHLLIPQTRVNLADRSVPNKPRPARIKLPGSGATPPMVSPTIRPSHLPHHLAPLLQVLEDCYRPGVKF